MGSEIPRQFNQKRVLTICAKGDNAHIILINAETGKVAWASGRDFRGLFKMEHSLALRRETVRHEDHHIEWRGPQMNQVEGAETLFLGDATDKPVR